MRSTKSWRWLPMIFIRLQLAAESGGALGLLVRDKAVRGQPSWAEVRWQVSPCPSTPEERRHGWFGPRLEAAHEWGVVVCHHMVND